MALLDSPWADPTSPGNGLLALAAAIAPQNQFAQGLLAYGDRVAQGRERQLKEQLLGAQISNYNSEVEQRKAALQKQTELMNFVRARMNGGGDAASAPAPSVNFGAGLPSDGSMLRTQPPAPAPQQGKDFVMGLSPTESLFMKMNGLDPVDVINAFKPKWENVGGNMVNTNDPNFKGGFIPQVKFDEKGGATMLSAGPNGMPQASIVPGSLDAYTQFRRAEAGVNAENELVKYWSPSQQREVYGTKAQALAAANGGAPAAQPAPPVQRPTQPQPMPAAQSGVNGNFNGDPAQVMSAIVSIKDPQERANAMAAFTEQAKRTQGFAQGAGFAAGPSTAETNAAAAGKVYGENVAKDIVEQRKAIMSADFSAPSNIAKYQRIGQLLADVDGGKFTPAGVEVASALNSLGIKVDKNLGNKEAAMAMANEAALTLRSPSGGAGMPGAMSDQDRQFLASMTPNISQSAAGRKQVIDAYVAVQKRNQQVAQFARKYETKYGKLDNGFFEQLSAWSNSNPLFGGK